MNNLPWQDIFSMISILAIAIPMLAIVSLPTLIIGGQLLSLLRERTAYAKCAKQISRLTLIMGWVLCIIGLVIVWMRVSPSFMTNINHEAIPLTMLFKADPSIVHLQADIIMWLTLLCANILITIVNLTWPTWEANRVVHQCTSLVSSFWYGMVVYGIVCIISAEHGASIGMHYPMSLGSLFTPSFESSFWNAGPYLLPLAFALGGGLVSVWLIISRRFNDFGRDYYAAMLKWCASWSRAAWFTLWFLLMGATTLQWLGTLQQEDYLTSPDFMQSALFLFLWLIPGVLWTLTSRSQTPLRHKTTMILAFVLSSCIIMPLYLSIFSL